MNLLDPTDHGHGLRCNLMRLLVSDSGPNRLLAMTLMETAEWTFAAISRPDIEGY